jgi:Ca2+-binding RTX toxin-like protein
MTTNYDQPLTTSELKTQLASSSLSQTTQNTIVKALGSAGGNVTETNTAVTVHDLSGAKIAVTAGGTINLSKATAADIKALTAIIITDDQQTDITIKNNNFSGTVVLGDGDGKVTLATNKAVTVETGKGNDSVATGSGGDSVVVSGGSDTVNTGSGNDKVVIKANFEGNAKLDGGSGANILSLSDAGTITIDAKGNLIVDLDKGGSSVTAKNFRSVILGNDASLVDSTKSKASMSFATGTGNDTIALGSGSDTIVVAGGNDSINTGAGVDIVNLASNFKGTLTLDGGAGKDTLDLSANTIQSVEKIDATRVIVTLENGAVLELANIENFVYDTNGDLYGGIKTVGLNTLDNAF